MEPSNRDTQTVWLVPAPAAVHQCGFPLSGHPPARTGAAPRPRTSEHGRVREGTTAAKKVEALFAELKNQIGLRRLRLRRLMFVREQFFLAAAAQNIKRLVRFLRPPAAPQLLTI
jgi:hypothetical protein